MYHKLVVRWRVGWVCVSARLIRNIKRSILYVPEKKHHMKGWKGIGNRKDRLKFWDLWIKTWHPSIHKCSNNITGLPIFQQILEQAVRVSSGNRLLFLSYLSFSFLLNSCRTSFIFGLVAIYLGYTMDTFKCKLFHCD